MGQCKDLTAFDRGVTDRARQAGIAAARTVTLIKQLQEIAHQSASAVSKPKESGRHERDSCVRKEFVTVKEKRRSERLEIGPDELTLEALLEMSDEQVCETVQKYGASSEECARLNASLSCLRNVHKAVLQSPLGPSGNTNHLRQCIMGDLQQRRENRAP
ncbi:UNVERIFIED_CONTAM: hypothetical protein FKN15_001993 [Acipenser sinensis]